MEKERVIVFNKGKERSDNLFVKGKGRSDNLFEKKKATIDNLFEKLKERNECFRLAEKNDHS